MDSKLDLFFYTENKGKKFALQWIVGDILKIPRTLDSPKFSFFPDSQQDDWFLRVEISKEESTSLSLHYDYFDSLSLRVDYTVTFRKPDGKWISEVSGNHAFTGKDSIVLHSNLNEIVKLGCTDTINLEFSFIIHGMDMETKTLYYASGEDGVPFVFPKNFAMIKEKKELVDLKIHVGNETFEVHKFILRLRAPKFVDEYLENSSVKEITVKDMKPDVFRHFLNYIYEAKIPDKVSSSSSEEFYEIVSKYGLKILQTVCVDELENILKFQNFAKSEKAVEYH